MLRIMTVVFSSSTEIVMRYTIMPWISCLHAVVLARSDLVVFLFSRSMSWELDSSCGRKRSWDGRLFQAEGLTMEMDLCCYVAVRALVPQSHLWRPRIEIVGRSRPKSRWRALGGRHEQCQEQRQTLEEVMYWMRCRIGSQWSVSCSFSFSVCLHYNSFPQTSLASPFLWKPASSLGGLAQYTLEALLNGTFYGACFINV